jgi:glycosyltransferase involved in cell wall biosynthesis
MAPQLTILIAARNAAATIERAVTSCAGEPGCRLILIDDHCTDDTVARARAVAGPALRVLTAPDPGGVPVARQTGLDAVETDFATWVDADDEWVPGRASRMLRTLNDGADVAVDAFDLFDGISGRFLRRLPIPGFLQARGGELRLFERNWLPGDSPVGFRTSVFRAAGGYDPAVYGPESYDLLLRAMARGARFSWSREVGYRIYAYPGSVSRHIHRQRAAVATALGKHDYERVRQLYLAAGFTPRVAAWAIVSMALFRNDPATALRNADEASPADADPYEILEAEGPWPFCEGWRRAFARGVALLMIGGRDEEAAQSFQRAEFLDPTPEGANNLGVAVARLGCGSVARGCWATAALRMPDFSDAKTNANAAGAARITTHPLRRLPARRDYAA